MSPRFHLSAIGITHAHDGNYYDTQGFHSLASVRETSERGKTDQCRPRNTFSPPRLLSKCQSLTMVAHNDLVNC
jgi:hypothetical protein